MSQEELEEKKKRRKKRKVKKKKAKKDACYHKVKARYDVWPSAYASGALVKCRKVGAKNWGKSKNENLQTEAEEFKPHKMYDPETGNVFQANTEQDHIDFAKKGYTHVDPSDVEDVLSDEGGAAGVKAIADETGASEEEVEATVDAMPDVGVHDDGDVIAGDDDEIQIQKEEKTKKKIRIRIIKKFEESK
tara:strand:+ start:1097 stop:1666 length:570 start_codon:yes stop_codon:yes gene_type:complete